MVMCWTDHNKRFKHIISRFQLIAYTFKTKANFAECMNFVLREYMTRLGMLPNQTFTVKCVIRRNLQRQARDRQTTFCFPSYCTARVPSYHRQRIDPVQSPASLTSTVLTLHRIQVQLIVNMRRHQAPFKNIFSIKSITIRWPVFSLWRCVSYQQRITNIQQCNVQQLI